MTTSTTAAGGPPEVWFGVRVESGELLIVRVDDTETVLGRETISPTEGDVSEATDIEVAGDTLLVGICCEPTSGSIYELSPGAGESDLALTDQGFRSDLRGSVFARTDTAGILGVWPSFPSFDGKWIDDGAHTADVAVDPGGDHVVTLVDPDLMVGDDPTGEPEVVAYRVDGDVITVTTRVPVEADRYCALVALESGQVGLLFSDGPAQPLDCTGIGLDVLDLDTGQLHPAMLEFDTPVRHLGVDESGRFMISTGVDGSVTWHTLSGEGGTLAETGYVVSNW